MKNILFTSASLAALTTGLAQAQESISLDELVISATAEPIEESRVGTSVEVLTGDALETDGTSLLADRLTRAPGISATQNGPAGTLSAFRIRGASESFSSVLVDGIKVNDPTTTEGQFAAFGSMSLAGVTRVEILKGAQSALYGGSAVAGVVNISTLPLADLEDGVYQTFEAFAGSFGTFSSAYSYAQKADRLTLSFGLSHARSDGFSAADETNGNTEADGFDETRISFGVEWEATETLTLGINGFVTDGESEFDEFGFPNPVDGTPDDFGTRKSQALRLNASYAPGLWTHDVSLSVFAIERTQVSPGSFESTRDGDRVRAEYQASAQVSDVVRLAFGLDYEQETSESSAVVGGAQSVETRGAFGELVYSPTSSFDLIATMRYDDHSDFGSETTGRLALSYRLSETLTLRGAAATGYRAPSLDELFGSYPDPLYPYFGNPDLQPETSQSIEVGLDYTAPSGLTLSATLFQNDIENFIEFTNCPVTIDFVAFSCDPGTFSTVENVAGTTTLQGAELSLETALSDALDLTVAYTFLDAKQENGTRLSLTPKHEVFARLEADLAPQWRSALDVIHVADRVDRSGNSMDDYTVVNLTVTYDINAAAEAYVTLNNVFDEQYQTSSGYGTADRSVFVGFRATF